MGIKPDIIFSGNKIISMTMKPFNIRFTDASSFCHMSLNNLAKTYNLNEGKDLFPYGNKHYICSTNIHKKGI